ncbi:protein-disulfide reductase DsbD [Luteimonas suaedae]|uniref:protein-disulfide reductase DsbD n=1 Tax=Luteimonas suaedae TaxID=2605430 RepID=UPI0011ECD055|nr:protein-disulfide reductase DsbD [Luteimonas suaedae]
MTSHLSNYRHVLAVLAACLLGTTATVAAAVDESDLLPVDEAFVLTAAAPTRNRIELDWKIADGYYLYRHRIDVRRLDEGFKINPLQLPAGHKHHDEFFGEVETYRDRLTAAVTGAPDDGMTTLPLQVKYQGCADAGVCYPPQTRTIHVALPAQAAPPAAGSASAGDGFAALGRALSGNGVIPSGTAADGTVQALPLPPEQAFAFEAIAGDGDTILMRFTPARGYYLYRDRSTFALDGADGIAAGAPAWPRGVDHHDEHFGKVVVYFDQVDVPLPLRRTRADAAEVTLTATFQGCQDEGICYPPMTRTVTVALPPTRTTPAPVGAVSAATGISPEAAAASVAAEAAPTGTAGAERAGDAADGGLPPAAEAGAPAAAAPLADDSRLAAALAGPDRLLALLGFFGAGLLLAFTPCVLPMIPILSGLIAGAGTRLGTGRALLLSFVYVLANALVFTVAGVVAALLGANLQIAFQTPWIIALFALLFVALALSAFGLYELQLPAAVRARLGAISDRQRGGSLAGVAAMGALSALIVGPCVAPPLAAAVLYIGESGDPVLGGTALFVLAMGMGLPLLAFGVAAGRGLPTSGPWMVAAQRVFGFVFLGLAVWMLSRILPGPATLALYGLLALAAAAWALAASTETPRTRLLARFAGLVLAVIGAAQLLGAMSGAHDPLRPLDGMTAARQPQAELPFRRIKTVADLDLEIAAAQAAGRPLLFDFYADWCVACKEMEKYTFPQTEVQDALAGFVLLKADVTANDAEDQALMRRYGVVGPPATLFFVDGGERRDLRLFGFEKAAAFAARVQRATGEAR